MHEFITSGENLDSQEVTEIRIIGLDSPIKFADERVDINFDRQETKDGHGGPGYIVKAGVEKAVRDKPDVVIDVMALIVGDTAAAVSPSELVPPPLPLLPPLPPLPSLLPPLLLLLLPLACSS